MIPPLPPHRVPLFGEWSLWRTAVLRSAGFPVAWLLRLAGTRAPEAIDRLLAAEAAQVQARRAAVELLTRAIETAAPEARRALSRLRDQASRGAPAAADHPDPEVAAALQRVQAAESEVKQRGEAALAAWREDALQGQGVLREIAADDRFREAVAWQNRAALNGSIAAFLRRPAGSMDSKTREYERLVARYVQRYCAKNETIGFFGPVAWATLSPSGPAVSLQHAEPPLSARRVYFEDWCIDALAQALGQDAELRPLMPPRRHPSTRLEGSILHYGLDKTVQLTEPVRRTLALCDGERPAEEIARQVAGEAALGATVEDVFGLLEDLAEKQLVCWTVEIAAGATQPDALLAGRLARLPASPARDRALESMRALEGARERVAAAAGSAASVDSALGELAGTFVTLTGREAQRFEGKAYAGRTLVYEDCVRNVTAQIGAPVLARLGPPLSLVLHSARWYTHELSVRYLGALREIHGRLARERGSDQVEFLALYEQALGLFPMDPRRPSAITAEVSRELQARWSSVLGLTEGPARIERSFRELQPGVEQAFPAPAPGWPEARYHSPDVMIAARDAEALARGDSLAVLGELHAGTNTLFSFCLFKEHPHPEELIRARAEDVPEACAELVTPKELSGRADNFSQAPQDVQVELGATLSWRPRAQVEAGGELVVEERAGRLVVRSRRTGRRFDGAAFFGCLMKFESTYSFHLLPELGHSPRVSIDGVVISRERWRFDPARVTFATRETPGERFVEAHRWARSHGLPRFVFLSVPEERKPVYLDFHSPALVESCWPMVRKASAVSVAEMLPAPDETWLADARGQRYCCELRLAAVDDRSWAPGA